MGGVGLSCEATGRTWGHTKGQDIVRHIISFNTYPDRCLLASMRSKNTSMCLFCISYCLITLSAPVSLSENLVQRNKKEWDM